MNIFDIARLAGVSRKTVQRILNNPESVKPDTREKVLRVMEEHHYEPNAAARRLSAKRSRTIGLFIVQDARSYALYSDDLYYGVVIGAAISRSAVRGYHTLVTILDAADLDPMYSLFRQKSIDGGLAVSWSDLGPAVQQVRERGFPIGVFDRLNAPNAALPVAIPYLDNAKGAADAVRHLAGLGHRDIAIVTGPMANPTAAERYAGFAEAMQARGLALPAGRVYAGDFTEAGGRTAIEAWLADGSLPSAVFCSNDLMAYGVLQALAERGIAVPGEISVIGFDDLLISQYSHPPLSTMRVPRVDMAVAWTDSLIDVIEGKEPQAARPAFLAELVVRGSTAPPATNR